MPSPTVNYKIRAIDETRQGLKSVRASFGGLKTVVAGLGAAVGAIGFARLVTGAIEAGDKLDKLTKKIGADVEDFQRLAQVADLSGVGLNTLGTALQRQTRRLSEATKGSGEAVKALEELGISANRISQLDPTEQFTTLAQALVGVADQGDRVRLAMRFWDTEGVELVNLIDQVGDSYFDLADAADESAVMTQEQIDSAVKAKDAWTKLRTTLEGLANTFILEFAEPIGEFLEYLRESIPAVKEFFNNLVGGYNQLRGNNVFKYIADLVFSIYDKIVALLSLLFTFAGATGAGGTSILLPGDHRGTPSAAGARSAPSTGINVIDRPVFTGAPSGALE